MEEKHFGPVWFIPGEKGGRYPYCHSIYIEGDGILIDPASDRKRLTELREHPGVKEIWLSHWHEDHFMHIDLFDDLPFRISEPDVLPLSDLDLFLDAYGLGEKEFRDYWRPILVEEFHFRPRKPAQFLKPGELVELDNVTVEIISTPGHTPGHLSFYFRELGILSLGDYDLADFGPWYGDVESDIEDTIQSVKKLRRIPAKVWFTGHETGLFEADPGALWDKYLHVIDEREGKLMAFIAQPRTMEEIVGAWIVYGKPREPMAWYVTGERALMEKHLRRLMRQGAVKEEGGKFYRI